MWNCWKLTSSGYRRLVKGSALRRVSRNQLARNAAVALGNSNDAAAIEPLTRCLRSHRSALVRLHAAWALGALGRSQCRDDLVEILALESDGEVRAEIAWAIATLDGGDS